MTSWSDSKEPTQIEGADTGYVTLWGDKKFGYNKWDW